MFAKSIASLLAVAGLASAARPLMARVPGNGTIITTTKVVTALPTWCPDPWNTITWKDKTYTVEGPTWFTITDCPCTTSYTTIRPTAATPEPPRPTHHTERPHPEPHPERPHPEPHPERPHPEPHPERPHPEPHPEPEPTHPEPVGPTHSHVVVNGGDSPSLRQGWLAGGLSVAAAVVVVGAAGW